MWFKPSPLGIRILSGPSTDLVLALSQSEYLVERDAAFQPHLSGVKATFSVDHGSIAVRDHNFEGRPESFEWMPGEQLVCGDIRLMLVGSRDLTPSEFLAQLDEIFERLRGRRGTRVSLFIVHASNIEAAQQRYELSWLEDGLDRAWAEVSTLDFVTHCGRLTSGEFILVDAHGKADATQVEKRVDAALKHVGGVFEWRLTSVEIEPDPHLLASWMLRMVRGAESRRVGVTQKPTPELH
ncbi:MAG: hypothetical protein R3E66_17000 [bacterium]